MNAFQPVIKQLACPSIDRSRAYGRPGVAFSQKPGPASIWTGWRLSWTAERSWCR